MARRDQRLGIAVASPTISSLFFHLHYEGHPWVWYVLLWIPARFTASPYAMKVVEGFIGTGIYLVIGLASPFSRREKLLLFLTYFVSFEYTVMSRMYGVAFLLALLYIWRRAQHPARVIGNAVLLGLIASTDLIGVIISGGLLCEYVYTLWRGRHTAQEPAPRAMRVAALAYLLIVAFSVWSLKPTSDVSWRTTGHPFAFAGSLTHLFDKAVTYTVLAFFPVQFRLHEWHYWWNADFKHHRNLYLLPFPFILAALYLCFRKRPNLMIATGVTLFGAIAYGHLIYDFGSTRHFGMTFVVFLCSLWLLRTQTARLPAAAIVLLGISATAGVVARVGEWRNPFSNAEATATWIQQHHLQNQPLVGYKDTSNGPGRGTAGTPNLHARMLVHGYLPPVRQPPRPLHRTGAAWPHRRRLLRDARP